MTYNCQLNQHNSLPGSPSRVLRAPPGTLSHDFILMPKYLRPSFRPRDSVRPRDSDLSNPSVIVRPVLQLAPTINDNVRNERSILLPNPLTFLEIQRFVYYSHTCSIHGTLDFGWYCNVQIQLQSRKFLFNSAESKFSKNVLKNQYNLKIFYRYY